MGFGLAVASDGFIVTGESFYGGSDQFCIVKFNTSGAFSWMREINSSGYGWAMTEVSKGYRRSTKRRGGEVMSHFLLAFFLLICTFIIAAVIEHEPRILPIAIFSFPAIIAFGYYNDLLMDCVALSVLFSCGIVVAISRIIDKKHSTRIVANTADDGHENENKSKYHK